MAETTAEGQETEPPERWVDREKRNGTIGEGRGEPNRR